MASNKTMLGRMSRESRKLGSRLAIQLGDKFHFSDNKVEYQSDVLLDVNNPHVVVCRKRGHGKLFTLGVLAKELASLEKEARELS